MCSSIVAVVLSLSILVLSEGLNKGAEKEFASGLLHVLDMEHAPNISSRRHDIPRYIFNLYRRKFASKSSEIGGTPSLGSATRIFFPQDLDEAASSVVLWFNLSSGGLNGTHRMRKAELHLQVLSTDGGIVQVSIVRMGQSLKADDKTTIASQECHKIIKSRWLVFNLSPALHSEVKERKEKLKLFISTAPSLRIALKGRRQPFLAVLTEPREEPQKELHRFLPLMTSQYASSNVTEDLGVTSMQDVNKRSKRSDETVCRKRRMAVRFRDLKWNGWIIAPTRFGFHYCEGSCPGTLSQETNPSNHAILQNILHHRLSKKIPAATCVPTELHSMSLLYYDTDDTIVLREVPGMVASNCGCR